MKTLSTAFFISAVILSDIMCAVIAYNYCNLLWGIKYAGYSAPAETAFLTAVPFASVLYWPFILGTEPLHDMIKTAEVCE